MPHIVLIGDSIFDNATYVPGESDVRAQVQELLPKEWTVTLLALDGSLIGDVSDQLQQLPKDATHIAVSAGGNDALEKASVLTEEVTSVGEAMERFGQVRGEFRLAYTAMLKQALASGCIVTACTVYDRVPGLGLAETTALSTFNEVILREAASLHVGIIDLRLICTQLSDYSALSPIEPSCQGGAKIARVLRSVLTGATDTVSVPLYLGEDGNTR